MAAKKYSGVVYGRLIHDTTEYQHGEPFETDDEQLWNELVQAGAVRLPSEVLTPEQVHERAQNAAATIEMQQNRIAELEAMLRAQSSESKAAPRKSSPEPTPGAE